MVVVGFVGADIMEDDSVLVFVSRERCRSATLEGDFLMGEDGSENRFS